MFIYSVIFLKKINFGEKTVLTMKFVKINLSSAKK